MRSAMAVLVDEGLDVRQIKEKQSVLQFEVTRKKLQAGGADALLAAARGVRPRRHPARRGARRSSRRSPRTRRFGKVLAGVQESLVAGDTFSAALTPYETLFPQFYLDMIRAAELTGRLDDVLDELSRYIKRDLEARSKVKSALTYPAVILLMSIATVIVLSVFVLPRFKVFFESLHATLPLPTRMLIGFTDFLRHFWWAHLDRVRPGRRSGSGSSDAPRAVAECATRSCSRCR